MINILKGDAQKLADWRTSTEQVLPAENNLDDQSKNTYRQASDN